MNLNKKMITWVRMPMLLGAVMLSISACHVSSEIVSQQNKDEMNRLVNDYNPQIENYLKGYRSCVKTLAEDVESNFPDDDELKRKLTELIDHDNNIINGYMGFESKKIINGLGWEAPADYNPVTRGWYTTAVDRDQPVILEPYIDVVDNNSIVSVVHRVTKDGKMYGVVGADISLKNLDVIVKSIKYKKSGFGFIVNNTDGSFVSHPEYSLEDHLKDVDGGKYQELANIDCSQPNIVEMDIGNEMKVIAIQPIKDTNWSIIVEVPKSELLE